MLHSLMQELSTKRNLDQNSMLFDAYERASTFMELQQTEPAVSFGLPRERIGSTKGFVDFYRQKFGGDLIDLKMSLPEYFVFSLVAKETSSATQKNSAPKKGHESQ